MVIVYTDKVIFAANKSESYFPGTFDIYAESDFNERERNKNKKIGHRNIVVDYNTCFSLYKHIHMLYVVIKIVRSKKWMFSLDF